jgi:hypothetical protein
LMAVECANFEGAATVGIHEHFNEYSTNIE